MMKTKLFTPLVLFLLLTLLAVAPASVQAQSKVTSTFNDFKSWVSRTTASAGDKTEEEWKQVKQEYKDFTDKIDRESSKLSASTRKEYDQLKADYKKTEADVERKWKDVKTPDAMPASGTMTLNENTLLGQYSDIDNIAPANMKDAFLMFMENVRANSGNWNDRDWDNANQVYKRLQSRREKLMDIPTSDEAKIQALQVEYKATKGGEKLKEEYKEMKK